MDTESPTIHAVRKSQLTLNFVARFDVDQFDAAQVTYRKRLSVVRKLQTEDLIRDARVHRLAGPATWRIFVLELEDLFTAPNTPDPDTALR